MSDHTLFCISTHQVYTWGASYRIWWQTHGITALENAQEGIWSSLLMLRASGDAGTLAGYGDLGWHLSAYTQNSPACVWDRMEGCVFTVLKPVFSWLETRLPLGPWSYLSGTNFLVPVYVQKKNKTGKGSDWSWVRYSLPPGPDKPCMCVYVYLNIQAWLHGHAARTV